MTEGVAPHIIRNGLSTVRGIAGETAHIYSIGEWQQHEYTDAVEQQYVKIMRPILILLKSLGASESAVAQAEKRREKNISLDRSINLVLIYTVVAHSGYHSDDPPTSEELIETLCNLISVITTYFHQVGKVDWYYDRLQSIQRSGAD